MALDFKEIKKQAQEEVDKENSEKAKMRLKSKMREMAAAKQVVANLEREMADLEDELQQSK